MRFIRPLILVASLTLMTGCTATLPAIQPNASLHPSATSLELSTLGRYYSAAWCPVTRASQNLRAAVDIGDPERIRYESDWLDDALVLASAALSDEGVEWKQDIGEHIPEVVDWIEDHRKGAEAISSATSISEEDLDSAIPADGESKADTLIRARLTLLSSHKADCDEF